MQILHIINTLETGGAEKLILDTLPLINENPLIRAELLLLNGKETPFLKSFRKNGIKIIDLKSNSLYNPTIVLKTIPYLRKYDIVHVHLFPSLYWVSIAKLISFSSTKLVYTEHSTNNKRLKNYLLQLTDRLIYRQYDKVVSITKEVKNIFAKHYPFLEKKQVVIENGVNLNTIYNATPLDRKSLNLNNSDFLLCMVASFRPAKNQDLLVKSLVKLPENIKLILVGDGERKPICEKLVRDLSLQNRVLFLGVRTDVPSIIKMANINVLSSYWEGLPLSAVEGMASGKPFLASNVEGLSSIVSGAGLLFSNEDELINHILQLMGDSSYHNQVAQACTERARKYDISLMIKKLENLYNAVYEGK